MPASDIRSIRRAPTARGALRRLAAVCGLAAGGLAACGAPREGGAEERALVVYNAGSLAHPLRVALDSFAARTGVRVDQESAGSLETARKLTELRKIPDVVALADEHVFPLVLMPRHVSWYARFARNRMVVAYTPRSRGAAEITPDNWWQVLAREGIEVGRSDPNLDPNGYRTLLVLQLAEAHYGTPGLAARVLANAPARNVRPKEADLVGLLQAGELDYVWSYESMAQAAGLRYVHLPAAIDLSAPTEAARYARAMVQVAGASPADTVAIEGRPIVYALAIPREAPHPAEAERFVAFLLSDDGRRVLRGAQLDVLDPPELVGTGAPAAVRATAAAGAP